MTKPYEPSEDVVADFAARLERETGVELRVSDARWILERYEPRTVGQRCDGSRQLFVFREVGESRNSFTCPGCPACTPKATPKGECKCGHVREQHTQGCRMTGCGCPYYSPPDDPNDSVRHAKAAIKLAEMARARYDRSRASDGVSEAITRTLTAPEAEIEQRGYELGYRAGRDVAAAANLKQVEHVVELGPSTMRALATLLTDRGGEKLLAMLGETKP